MSVGASKQPAQVASKSVLASWLTHGVVAGVALAGALLAVSAPTPVVAREALLKDGEAVVALATLPPQARQTHARILAGGPFPYPHKDGSVFVNRERLLPLHPRGYYREYTVKTPGVSHRGARRIVCGGQRPTLPDTCYYTADHYASFSRIVQ
ncbi:MAG: ribonuclease [Burkholderiaceae bacterium]|nr:ribonuclease [Burkholderiaceae bacterium]